MAKDFSQGMRDRARQNRYEDAGFEQKKLSRFWNAFRTPKHYRPPKDKQGRHDYLAGWKKQGWK